MTMITDIEKKESFKDYINSFVYLIFTFIVSCVLEYMVAAFDMNPISSLSFYIASLYAIIDGMSIFIPNNHRFTTSI